MKNKWKFSLWALSSASFLICAALGFMLLVEFASRRGTEVYVSVLRDEIDNGAPPRLPASTAARVPPVTGLADGTPTTWPERLVIDTHSHTYHSDGNLSVRENIDWHVAMGYNVIFVTDHNTFSHVPELLELQEEYAKHGIYVFPGFEYTSARVHFNCLGVYSFPSSLIPHKWRAVESDRRVRAAIEACRSAGGFVTWNHQDWTDGWAKKRGTTSIPLNRGLEWGVDAVEVVNSNSSILRTINDTAAAETVDQFCAYNSELCPKTVASTDMHHPLRVNAAVYAVSWAAPPAEPSGPPTPASVLAHITARTTELHIERYVHGVSSWMPARTESQALPLLASRVLGWISSDRSLLYVWSLAAVVTSSSVLAAFIALIWGVGILVTVLRRRAIERRTKLGDSLESCPEAASPPVEASQFVQI